MGKLVRSFRKANAPFATRKNGSTRTGITSEETVPEKVGKVVAKEGVEAPKEKQTMLEETMMDGMHLKGAAHSV